MQPILHAHDDRRAWQRRRQLLPRLCRIAALDRDEHDIRGCEQRCVCRHTQRVTRDERARAVQVRERQARVVELGLDALTSNEQRIDPAGCERATEIAAYGTGTQDAHVQGVRFRSNVDSRLSRQATCPRGAAGRDGVRALVRIFDLTQFYF